MTARRSAAARVRAALADMAHANNRRFELQTGLVVTAETAARRRREEIARLETILRCEPPETTDLRPRVPR